MLSDTDRSTSVDLDEFNAAFARAATDLPPSAYAFSLCGTVCKTLCCGGKNSAFSQSWKFPKNLAQFQDFGAEWV